MKYMTKKNLCILLVIYGILLIYLVHLTRLNTYTVPENLKNITTSKTKYVLYWTPFWKDKDFCMGFGYKPFENCEYKNCFATNKQNFVPIQEFDAIIFHASIYNKKKHRVPKIRLPHQIYIFMNLETPIHNALQLKQFKSFFNWTMSYRFDSDIITRHGHIIKGKTNYTLPSREFLGNKTKLSTWFVSNCKSKSHREDLTRELQKHILVDIYGKCGTLKCERLKKSNLSPVECYLIAEKMYKFYFSFENSYCKDYTTEKLYNVLSKNIVPVVYGAGGYNISAPPNSIINVADFKSAKDLADYLTYLDQNNDEYLKYFEWKKDYTVTRSWKPSACQICKKLNEPLQKTVYDDIQKWWEGDNDSICKKGAALPKIVTDVL